MQKDISFPAIVPADVQNTIRWLLRVEEFSTASALAHSIYKYLPQDKPEASDFLAMVLNKAKRYKEALPYARKTVMLLPTPEAKFNLAKCLHSAGYPEEAESIMAEVMKERPQWIDPAIDHAVYIAAQGRFDEAEAALRRLLDGLAPSDRNFAVVQFNLGWHEVRAGNFKKGMAMLGIGRQLRIWGAYSFPYSQPMLQDGQDVRGKRILMVGEGGAGDEIINIRFAQVLKDRGAQGVYFTSNHKLNTLFARTPGLDQVVTHQQPPPEFDYWAPAMDLPRILQLDSADIPKGPYLLPAAEKVKEWEKRIPNNGKLRIGIRWQGNALYEQDLMRSVPFKLMEQFADLPGVEVYSLQRDDGLEEMTPGTKVVDLSGELTSWEETAAAISNLDLIISSCTSVPHMAAAIGKEVWLYAPLSSYYVWSGPDHGREWYPQIQLFNQDKFGSWESTHRNVLEALKSRLATKAQAGK